jgi:hypothetical protein
LQFAGPREPSSSNQGGIGFHNWQSTKMTVKERISFLFNSSILSDVTFIVGRYSTTTNSSAQIRSFSWLSCF